MMYLKKSEVILKKNNDFQKRILETEVLVNGSGGSGLRAAIGSAYMGSRAIVVAKEDFPLGYTPISMSGILASFAPNDSEQIHLQDFFSGGDFLNEPHLVKLLTK